MTHGLSSETVSKICTVFSRYPIIERAILYGSRAKGTYKKGSDIDLTLLGAGLTQHDLFRISDDIDDLFLPYMIDLSRFETLTLESLQDHIQRVGIVFYEKKKTLPPTI